MKFEFRFERATLIECPKKCCSEFAWVRFLQGSPLQVSDITHFPYRSSIVFVRVTKERLRCFSCKRTCKRVTNYY